MVALGSPAELKESFGTGHLLMLESSDLLGAMTALQGHKSILDVAVFGSGLHVKVDTEADGEREIREVLNSKAIRIDTLEPIPPTMEDVFVGLIENEERMAAK